MLVEVGVDSGVSQKVSSQRRSKKEEMFDKQMESYQRDRDIGMPKPPAGRL